MSVRRHTRSTDWVAQIFTAKAVARGGVVRRSTAWVEAEIGRDLFIAEVARRGFHLFEAGGQFVIVCSSAPIRRLL